jgi:hypothetical protein
VLDLNHAAARSCMLRAGNLHLEIWEYPRPVAERQDPKHPLLSGVLSWSTQHFILNDKMECLLMVQVKRRGFTSAEKAELWDRWQRGESFECDWSCVWQAIVIDPCRHISARRDPSGVASSFSAGADAV